VAQVDHEAVAATDRVLELGDNVQIAEWLGPDVSLVEPK